MCNATCMNYIQWFVCSSSRLLDILMIVKMKRKKIIPLTVVLLFALLSIGKIIQDYHTLTRMKVWAIVIATLSFIVIVIKLLKSKE